MKFIRASIFLLAATLLTYCSKSNGGTNEVAPVVPTDLNVVSTVSSDNSGTVTFTATAKNAASYDYDFGNGTYQTVASGVVTYKYPQSGTYTVNVIAKSKSNKTISKSLQVVVTVSASLKWSDEFNTPGAPDATKWGYDLGTGDGGWGNNEQQYYTNRPENVVVANGVLKITAKRENFSGSAFTSARLLTKGKFDFTYGTLEVKAKLPSGGGVWPAIWMLGSNFSTVGWPVCGEIDVMEYKGNEPNKIYSTLHHPGHSGGNGDSKNTTISNASTEFHVYKAEWSATAIKFYVDDTLFYTFPNNNTIPFNHDFFIILNVAMGGTFGGAINPNYNSSSMEVDYVRVYQ
ncbi:glycosyl hydrolase family protein [Mucilaginibacter limnophilus]|uniref:Glycosyl hydrolase family protein n=1 Tax=Mucilaginibacter limnophilus TaxID=1932778 RepID=A0A437MTP6_9SPHI|nr:family 16 glycosylhydrolase [Mucilaginibacter limnophilus]RVU01036.1 glycosyl hydrolase family protein [Mucilaginibacter limnophilus]